MESCASRGRDEPTDRREHREGRAEPYRAQSRLSRGLLTWMRRRRGKQRGIRRPHREEARAWRAQCPGSDLRVNFRWGGGVKLQDVGRWRGDRGSTAAGFRRAEAGGPEVDDERGGGCPLRRVVSMVMMDTADTTTQQQCGTERQQVPWVRARRKKAYACGEVWGARAALARSILSRRRPWGCE
jgi:hypothetical protein